MNPWKYVDAARRMVSRELSEDAHESCIADREDVLAWIAEGNMILPHDPPLPPSKAELAAEAARGDPKLVALIEMPREEFLASIDGISNLAQARDVIKTLAVAIRVLARGI